MVRIIQSRDIPALLAANALDPNTVHHAYNALDSAVTIKVHSALDRILAQDNEPHGRISYHFSRAMQGPAMAMMRKGIAVNSKVKQDETQRYIDIRDKAQSLLDRLADAVWGPEQYIDVVKARELYTPVGKRGNLLTPRYRTTKVETVRQRPRGLNASSSTQCLAFFNTALNLPVQYEIRKTAFGRERTPTANDKALRKWAGARSKGPGISPRDSTVPAVPFAAPFVSLILTIREADKMLAVLRSPLDPDSRMRCSYNVAGTENWRWSSSKNVLGRGTNLQNITPSMRRMFCADDDHYFVSTDLEQAESWVTGGCIWAVTGDMRYVDAIRSGDLHTAVARMCYPELPWTDDPKANRKIADSPSFHPKYTYREIAKRLGHGTNYEGSAYGIAQAVGLPVQIVEDFQARYFLAFPEHRTWHAGTKEQIRQFQYLDTPYHQRRWFFGRPDEAQTHREAIACVPQGTVGTHLNYIMWRCWARSLPGDPFNLDLPHLPIDILLQNHDAFAFQVHTKHDLPWIIDQVNSEFVRAPITFVRGDERLDLTIPGEFVTGFNWAYKDNDPNQDNWTFADGNPDGLVKWRGSETRRRQQGASPSPSDWIGGGLGRRAY